MPNRALTNPEKSNLEESMSWDEVQAARKKVLWNVCKKQPQLNSPLRLQKQILAAKSGLSEGDWEKNHTNVSSEPDPESLKTGKDVTFPEFAKYLTNAKPAKMDGHWKPIHDMVLPCGVNFDYIGKLETGHRDSVNILKRAHVDHLVYFKESTRNVSHDESVFHSFFDQLGPEHIKGLYKQYELDFKLFDYTLPENMRPWVFGKR
ncbi:putative carbohydrate sulfotransferase 11-like [Apostichopus japonicus]|uniref:Carbohydrate sulfotransferase n=1 Tax=Stichopus japonicus TaxID=307972 RepID=A0A2G8KUD2_STIJA|nr:putative carbohydrate sulfotransferase 11-like [Apostichopus japonicus]